MITNQTIRIATIPCIEKELNPYLKIFYKGLRPFGIEVVSECTFSRTWLWEHRNRVDLIHFHWEYWNLWDWGYLYPRFLPTADRLSRNVAKLMLAKRWGYKIVWTVHDFFPSGRYHLALLYLAYFSLAQLSDGVFVNFGQAVDDVHRRFLRKRRVYHIPHGNYRLWYPNTVSKEEARTALDLPAGAFVYLLFGAMRPNREVKLAVSAFQNLTSPNSQETYMLIVGANNWGSDKEDVV